MYETMTYDVIMQRMLNRVSTVNPDVDVRQGSIIYDALAPAAVELAVMYLELDNTRNESFVATATREYKLLGCQQIGVDISQFNATYGVYKGEFNVQIEIGSRWNLGQFNYTVTEYIQHGTNYEYKLQCETSGAEPNAYTGALTPISDVPSGLEYAEITGTLIEGGNEASDEEIDRIYFTAVNGSDRDGNISQYNLWCEEFNGIGKYKIIPLWDGANTVKVSILSETNQPATQSLIDEFQEYLDPDTEGMGNGKAPIGAFVTVSTASTLAINVAGTITQEDGYSGTADIDEALTALFADMAYTTSGVNYMTVGAAILAVQSVASLTGLTINDGTTDISLTSEQIPILGTTSWTVS